MLQLDFSFIFILYFVVIMLLIIMYIYADDNRQIITGVVSILSGSTIALGLLNYLNSENIRKTQEEQIKKRDYIDFISKSFDKIDSYYLENTTELNELFYEFYGYSNFPEVTSKLNKNNGYHTNGSTSSSGSNTPDVNKDTITGVEYITLLKIIQHINIMYVTNPAIFEDINFRNKLINYTRSHKFKKVLSYNKNDFSSEFIDKLNKLKIVSSNDIAVEQISVPKIG